MAQPSGSLGDRLHAEEHGLLVPPAAPGDPPGREAHPRDFELAVEVHVGLRLVPACRNRLDAREAVLELEHPPAAGVDEHQELAHLVQVEEACEVLLAEADVAGAHAVIGIRYDATEVMSGVTEVICYGTAVQVEPLAD